MTEAPALYSVTPAGQAACRLCHALDHGHARDCPVVAVRLQLRELAAELALFVATMRETLDTVDQLLRGGGEGDAP